MKLVLLAIVLISASARAANTCNPYGATLLECLSSDGRFQIEISEARDITGLNFVTNTFCRSGFLKINGVELNGPLNQPSSSYLDYVSAVTSTAGSLPVTNPLTKVVENVQTAIEFDLTSSGVAQLANAYPGASSISGGAIVYPGNSTGKLFLSVVASPSVNKVIGLTCR